MKRIVYSNPDGSVSVVLPVINTGETISEAQAVERAMKKLPAHAASVVVLDPSAIPTDRFKRYAWRIVSGTVIVDPAVPEPEQIRRSRQLEELKGKRRAGKNLTAAEQQELLDLLLGV